MFFPQMRRMSLYASHVPTTPFQKGLLAIGSAVGALANPTRDGICYVLLLIRLLDFIANLGETTGAHALARLREKMRANQSGSEILRCAISMLK